MTATRIGLHSGRPESPPAMLTVMAVGITTSSSGEGEGDTSTPLVVGDATVDERAGWAPVLVVGWVRKAPRSSTIRMPRPAKAVTAIEPIRPAVVEMRGCRRARPLGATGERYASKRKSESPPSLTAVKGGAHGLEIVSEHARQRAGNALYSCNVGRLPRVGAAGGAGSIRSRTPM
jgi:hypothetical protein